MSNLTDILFMPILDGRTLLMFLPAVLALNLTPGPDLLLVLSQSIEGGRRAGLYVAFGIAVAGLVQISLVATGITVLLTHSTEMLWFLQIAGCVYLIYAGLRMLIIDRKHAESSPPLTVARHAFRHGFVVNLLNPQVGLFFLAFIPQFINVSGAPAWAQVTVLGLILKTCGLLINSAAAVMFAKISASLVKHHTFLRHKSTFSGSIFLIIAVVLIFRALQ